LAQITDSTGRAQHAGLFFNAFPLEFKKEKIII
jgi:hypothetical protein